MRKISKLFILLLSVITANTTAVCAKDFTFYLYGKTYDCYTPYALKVGTRENCEVNCPNRVYIFSDRTCRLKVGESKPFNQFKTADSVDSSNCQLKTGESSIVAAGTYDETYFKDIDDNCYSCSTQGSVTVDKTCNMTKRFCHQNCKQRVRRESASGNTYYSERKCPSNRPLMDRFMMCWSCDEKTPIDLSFNTNFDNVCSGKNKRKFLRDNIDDDVSSEKLPFSVPD